MARWYSKQRKSRINGDFLKYGFIPCRRAARGGFLARAMVSNDVIPAEQLKLLDAKARTMKLYVDILRQRLLVGGIEVEPAGDPPAFQDLMVECVEGQLRISVGVKAFANALSAGSHGMRKLEVIDAEVFAEVVAKKLKQVIDGNGATLLHNALSEAARLAEVEHAHWIERSPPPVYPATEYAAFIDRQRPTPYIPVSNCDDK